ncbi:MAG: 2-oxoglutarate dehydrogenase E1 component, partial [Gammaproteobacteria bacterium]|nr:2-oxoglutarate dehydrogenase E1 component [Gammaproteobacteria bacterium]
MKKLAESSYLSSANAPFVEEQYAVFLNNPADVSEDWQILFRNLQASGELPAGEPDHKSIRNDFKRLARSARANRRSKVYESGAHESQVSQPVSQQVPQQQDETAGRSCLDARQVAVLQYINAYRFRGHQHADIDPIVLRDKELVPELHPAFHKLGDEDLDTVFNTGSLVGAETATLREIIEILHNAYCSHIGVEYMHITDTQQKRWIQQRVESKQNQVEHSVEHRLDTLERILAATEFEKYLHTRYVGQKRFSLEGAECLIPMLHQLIQQAGEHDVTEVVLGMAHRGRLNVLTNILGKAPASLFEEFEGNGSGNQELGSGDVKYHQGFSSDI